MSRKPSMPKVKSQMLMKETFYRTKRFFHKTFKNLKLFISKGYQKLPKAPTPNPIISCGNKINSKLQELDNFYRGFCEHWDSMEKMKKRDGHYSPKVQTKADEQCSKSSMSVADCSGLVDLNEGNNARYNIGRKQGKSGYLSAHALVQKMRELEMMDVKDMDHVLDVEEVLHYYSRLSCPAYVEIIDKFFMDMYSELNVPEQSMSVDNSMRKLGSSSVHSSMRSLDLSKPAGRLS